MTRPENLPDKEVISILRDRVARNPGDLDAGLMLGSVLYKAGDLAGSASALRKVLQSAPDHSHALLLLARTEARAGNRAQALEVLGRGRRADPANPQFWQLACALVVENRDWPALLAIAADWVRHHPKVGAAWKALSRAHFEESRFTDAIAAFATVLELAPNDPTLRIDAARLAIAAQRYSDARTHLEAARVALPDSPDLHYTLGRVQHMTGELAGAEASYRQAIRARPDFATAYVELGALREGRLDDDELGTVARLFADTAQHPEYRVMLGFTLGDALERRARFAEAFNAWDRANGLNRSISDQEGFMYQPQQVDDELTLLAGIFSAPLDVDTGPATPGLPVPIFVVGMPRSGTTLVESILAAHSRVAGAGELPAMYDIHEELLRVARSRGVDAARALIRDKASAWRTHYLAGLPADANAAFVVDKQPMNFRAVGLIRLLFPASPVIWTTRDPLDVGLSIYRHKFAKNWPCAHDLGHIGHYYGFHDKVLALWDEHCSGAIAQVPHAALIRDTQTRIRGLLAFAGLEYEEACLSPHKSRRPVATFSAVQVQQPITASYSGRASRYPEQLAPLRHALEKAGISLPAGRTVD